MVGLGTAPVADAGKLPLNWLISNRIEEKDGKAYLSTTNAKSSPTVTTCTSRIGRNPALLQS
jgi:hypothetical protein